MMSFSKSVKTCCIDKVFNWRDRASRSEFWWFYLFQFIASYALALIAVIPILGWIIYLVGVVYFWWVTLMVSIRRLHDKDRSGFYLLIPVIPCLIFMGSVTFTIMMNEQYYEEPGILSYSVMGISGLFFLGTLVYMLILFVTEGTHGPNRFGQDPIAYDRMVEAEMRSRAGLNTQGYMADPNFNQFGHVNPNYAGPGFSNQNFPNQNFNNQNYASPNGQAQFYNTQGFTPQPPSQQQYQQQSSSDIYAASQAPFSSNNPQENSAIAGNQSEINQNFAQNDVHGYNQQGFSQDYYVQKKKE